MAIREMETGKMFFLQQRNYKQHYDKLFLTHFRSVLYNSFFTKIPLVLTKIKQKNVVRRMSLRSPLHGIWYKSVTAGVTLEAALVLPIFVFFILNIFSVMEMLRLYGNVAYALNKVGGDVALYGHIYGEDDKQWDMGIVGDIAFTYLYFKNELLGVLGEEYIEKSPLVNGENGLFFTKARIMEDNLVEIEVTYEMEMPFPIGAAGKVRTYNTYCGRAWTGYELENTKEEMVYVSKTGTVYHTHADCSYLKIVIYKVGVSEAETLTNYEGFLYSPCEICGNGKGNVAWITKSGDKYHMSENCTAIRRTVYEMSLEKAKEKGLEKCSRCESR